MGHTAGNELPVSVCVVKKQAVHHQVKGKTSHTKKVIRKKNNNDFNTPVFI